MNNGDSTYPKMNKKNLIELGFKWNEVKDCHFEFEWNGWRMMAWLMLIDKEDKVVSGWQFRIEGINDKNRR